MTILTNLWSCPWEIVSAVQKIYVIADVIYAENVIVLVSYVGNRIPHQCVTNKLTMKILTMKIMRLIQKVHHLMVGMLSLVFMTYWQSKTQL